MENKGRRGTEQEGRRGEGEGEVTTIPPFLFSVGLHVELSISSPLLPSLRRLALSWWKSLSSSFHALKGSCHSKFEHSGRNGRHVMYVCLCERETDKERERETTNLDIEPEHVYVSHAYIMHVYEYMFMFACVCLYVSVSPLSGENILLVII